MPNHHTICDKIELIAKPKTLSIASTKGWNSAKIAAGKVILNPHWKIILTTEQIAVVKITGKIDSNERFNAGGTISGI